jgi:hypothetical protein
VQGFCPVDSPGTRGQSFGLTGSIGAVAMMPSQREIAAYHEAGHAVVALAFRARGLKASIKPRGISRGRVGYDSLPALAADVVLFITLAGPFAHRRFAPRSNWFGGSDFAIVAKIIFGKGSKGTTANKEKYLAHVVDQAEQIVDYFWIDIRVAAKALLKHDTLTRDEIASVIRVARRKSRRCCRIGDPPAFALMARRAARR